MTRNDPVEGSSTRLPRGAFGIGYTLLSDSRARFESRPGSNAPGTSTDAGERDFANSLLRVPAKHVAERPWTLWRRWTGSRFDWHRTSSEALPPTVSVYLRVTLRVTMGAAFRGPDRTKREPLDSCERMPCLGDLTQATRVSRVLLGECADIYENAPDRFRS